MKEAKLVLPGHVGYDYDYRESRLNTNWDDPVADIDKKIFFLNQFRCRIPRSIAKELLSVVKGVVPLFSEVNAVEIQDINEREEIYPNIEKIFNTLSSKVSNFRSTATSKFMHMTCPNLFVMMDSVIEDYMFLNDILDIRYYGGPTYVSLLKYYCTELNELVEDIIQNHRLNPEEALNQIRGKDPYAVGSIPRIIDKHFYRIATRQNQNKR